jgi:rRNA-processing protein FCF1
MTPIVLDMTALLERYRAGLLVVTDVELERRATVTAALPGRVAGELRRLVDAEREARQVAKRQLAGSVVTA